MEENLQQPCGCEDTAVVEAADTSVGVLQNPNECNRTVSELVCVEAQVTITPTVHTGPVTVSCVGNPSFEPNFCNRPGFTRAADNTCRFTVSQLVCVNVPVEIGANANAALQAVFCGPRSNTANCPVGTIPCTHTRIGFIQDRELTLALLAQAGGQIVLGGAPGITVTVTAANIFAILQGTDNTIPANLRQLVAQLLAARLNVLNGAGCTFATAAIAAANAFLVAGGQDQSVAAQLAADLRLFNRGAAPGCPDRCPGTADD